MNQLSGKTAGKVSSIAFAALMLGHAAQGLTFTAFTPGLPAMAQSFNANGHGMDIAQQSVTIAALGVVAGSILSGKIVDIIGSRATMLTMLAIFGITGLGGLFLSSPWALLTSRVVNGFAVACLVTACVTTISILFDGNARAKAIGTAGAIGAATSLVGLLLGGILAQQFGWRAAFIQFPVFAVLGLLLAFTGIRDNAKQVHEPSDAIHSWMKIVPLFVLTSIISLVMFMGSTQLAFLLPQDGISASTTISLVMGTITVFAVLVGLGFGTLEHRLGLQPTLALGFALCGAGLALIGLASSLPAAFAGAALLGAYVGITVPYPYHAVTMKTPLHARAKAIGLVGAFNFLGAFINPFIFGPMTKAFGLHHVFIIVAAFMGVLALGAILKGRTGPGPMVTQHS
jgi:MFS family permease